MEGDILRSLMKGADAEAMLMVTRIAGVVLNKNNTVIFDSGRDGELQQSCACIFSIALTPVYCPAVLTNTAFL
ncbi:hypothetical protein VIN01S_08420 [Vibrio inusitatus NBRC 102082]|uniref:Uncharacterized protein n=1 Tax=Vibrio inusitatus NBRC 102082 TaxID=1219070 RepID=A0A4Y3HSK8_9VIBR|nr:hypothetical protein VIN01S_08420 [Vibrio inusitatus NBRC 102082]